MRAGRQRNHLRAFSKLVDRSGADISFANRPPSRVPIEELDERGRRRYVGVILDFLEQYRASLGPHRAPIDGYRHVHLARKVVGVGGVGTRGRWWCSWSAGTRTIRLCCS